MFPFDDVRLVYLLRSRRQLTNTFLPHLILRHTSHTTNTINVGPGQLHIVEDDQAMSSRLGLDSVPTRFVDDCYHHLLIDKKDDIMWVVDEAKNEEGYYCEADEAQMCGYLVRLLV